MNTKNVDEHKGKESKIRLHPDPATDPVADRQADNYRTIGLIREKTMETALTTQIDRGELR